MTTPLFEGDPRCEVLLKSLMDVLYERGKGLPIPSVLGVIELMKMTVINEA